MLGSLGLFTATLFASVEATLVSVLSGHSGDAWGGNASCQVDGSLAKMKCNLLVYEQAAQLASANGAELLVHPEGYGLTGKPLVSGYWEIQASNGSNPCLDKDTGIHMVQHAISCSAVSNKIAIATNLFLLDHQGNRRITEIVFDKTGMIVATHYKMHKIGKEEDMFLEGDESTTFSLLGRRLGILVCYEGAYPYIGSARALLGQGNFSQMDQMKSQGADTFIWSIGAMIPDQHFGGWLARKFGVSVVASEMKSIFSPEGAIIDPMGKEADIKNIPMNFRPSLGYTAKAFVQVAVLPAASAESVARTNVPNVIV